MTAAGVRKKARRIAKPVDIDMWELLATGKSLAQIAKQVGLSKSEAYRRLSADAARYAHARATRAHGFEDEIQGLADSAVRGTVPPDAARVAIDARKWLAGRMDPKGIGDLPEGASLNINLSWPAPQRASDG